MSGAIGSKLNRVDGRAKVELALAKGRRQYDKRHAIATRDASREAAREARAATKGSGYR